MENRCTSIDQGKPVILVPLNLFSAFEIVDHNVLFSWLKGQRSQRVSNHGILF
jgi:hypothetical protein